MNDFEAHRSESDMISGSARAMLEDASFAGHVQSLTNTVTIKSARTFVWRRMTPSMSVVLHVRPYSIV